MLKKLTQKPYLFLLGSGILLSVVAGSIWLTPKVMGWVEQWSRTAQVSFEETPDSSSVVFKLVSAPQDQRISQLRTIAQSEQPSLERSRARYLLAVNYLKQLEGGKALQQLEGLEEQYPLLAAYVLLKRGRGYELTNENTQAVETWKKLLQTYPDSSAVPETLYYLGKYEPQYWDEAIAKYPQNPHTWAVIEQRLKQNPNQPQLMLILAKYNPFDPEINQIRDRLVKDYAKQLTPQDWEIIANGYWEQGEYQKATQAYFKSPLTPINLYHYARGLHRTGQKPQAKQAYQKLVKKFPKAPETGQALMYLVKLSGQKEALGYLNYVIKNFPEQAPDALQQKAELLDKMNSKAAAAKVRQTLLETYPNSDAAAEYRWQVAQKYAKIGDSLKAWQWAQPITANNPDSSIAPKAAFWVGKWAQKLGRTQDAKDAFTYTLGRYPQSYYAWRSAVQLGWKVGDFNNVRYYAPTVVKPQERAAPPSGSKVFQEFYRLGLDEEAWDLFRAEVANPWQLTLNEQFTLGLLRQTQQHFLKGINLILDLRKRETPEDRNQWQALRQQPEYWYGLFPFPYEEIIVSWSQQRSLNPLLVTSLIRQESRFEKEIRSPAGALGLMQVMPATAKWIADKINLDKYSLTNPNDNVKLGTWYLDHTHQEYGNNSMLAVASYNAGPGNVSKWVKQFQLSDPDEFVEKIPFAETKGYVESVFGNYWNYLRIYNPDVAQMMSKLSN